ncbi:Lrp/AsnC family transcriptional regulator [Pelagibius sp.]|uniref:Lrp/AsnC family transcriptional regulator n=1 Tax=Pelagibius sp. TaxID=1931238 RepID=UPI003B502071
MKRRLDDIDRAILGRLRANAREPLSALAAKVGRSRSAVQERLQRLERDGVIAGYTLRSGTPRQAAGLQAYLFIKMTGPLCARIAPQIERFPEVQRCVSLAGDIDMALLVDVEDIAALEELRERIARMADIVTVTTAPILSVHFDRR